MNKIKAFYQDIYYTLYAIMEQEGNESARADALFVTIVASIIVLPLIPLWTILWTIYCGIRNLKSKTRR